MSSSGSPIPLLPEGSAVSCYLGELIDAGLDCLIFTVAGVRLALPQAEVAAVLACPGMGEGSLADAGKGIPIVDLAALVAPGAPPAAYDHVLVLRERGLAIAVSGKPIPVRLDPDTLTWRTERTHRPWLAAVSTARGIALLDLDGVAPRPARK